MKVVIVSGDPNQQESLIKDLLAASLENDQQVHLHNALHSEMSIVAKTLGLSVSDSRNEYTRFYNEALGLCLTTLYKSAFVGHTIGYSYANFTSTQKELLDKVVTLSKATTESYFTSLISNVKDVKYVDTLIIYNVINPEGLLQAVRKINNSYSREDNRFYWLHYPSSTLYDCLTDESKRTMSNISNLFTKLAMGTDHSKQVESIIVNTTTDDTQVKTSSDVDFEEESTNGTVSEEAPIGGDLPTPEPLFRWTTSVGNEVTVGAGLYEQLQRYTNRYYTTTAN